MDQLDHDCLRLLAQDLALALRMALVCKSWRDAMDWRVGGHFDVRKSLVSLGKTALLTEVMTVLALTPTTVKLYAHKTKRRYGGGVYKIFEHSTVVQIYRAHGGAAQLEVRLARRVKRQAAYWNGVAEKSTE